MKILIIGGGNMGRTYADSFLSNHAVKKEDLFILEHSEEKVKQFQSFGFQNVFFEVGDYISEMKIIILAVKPQDSQDLFERIKPFMHANQVVISIMAGITIKTIAQNLAVTHKIIRAMPNLPTQIGMGMTGFTSSDSVGKQELLQIHNLLNTTGKSLYFEDEHKLDAVTAISGSGPAFVFYFMDAMIESAMEMGFTQSEAELLVEQTFLGAVHLEKKSDLTCQEWIARVASRGGTTEAALKSFEKDSIKNNIKIGLEKALVRAQELGK